VRMKTAPFDCAPCERAKAYFDRLERGGAIDFFVTIGGASSYPEISVYKNGQLVWQFNGFPSDPERKAMIDQRMNDLIRKDKKIKDKKIKE